MTRMNGQTKIIVATACCLALVDIGVRLLAPTPNNSNCSTCPPLTSGNGVVRARAIELVDAENNVRGLWNTDANGEPALWMYDKNGATRIELDTTDTTPSLSLHDSNGNRRVYFGMNHNNGAGLFTMTDPDSESLTYLLEGSANSQHFRLNGNGMFMQTDKVESALGHPRPPQETIYAQGVLPAGPPTLSEDAKTIESPYEPILR